jgi:hypothetical protein
MHNMSIFICSDSKATLLALSSYTISSKLLNQCWLSLQDISHNYRMRLFWVPVHCDIKGNEEAERVARVGSDSYFCGPEPYVPLSASIVRDMNRKSLTQVANNQIPHEPKKQLRILVSLITEHCCLNKHLHRMELTTKPCLCILPI